jgi:hypothetical protein
MKSLFILLTRICPVICISFLTTAASAQLWTFASDAQGWRVNDMTGSGNYVTSQGTLAANWNAMGGNPGGYISATDPSIFTFMFQAPSAQLGDYSQYLGGQLKFSLQTDLSTDYMADSVVVFRGGMSNQTLVSAITPAPNSTWTNYSISLFASEFHYDNLSGATVSETDFASVLSGLNDFLINAEYHNGVAETTGLDSVSFTSAVPEPSTYGIVAAFGLLSVIALRRLRKS